MRKAIIIVIPVIIFVTFLSSSFAQHHIGNIAVNVADWFKRIIEVPERSKIIALRDDFMRNNMSLQPIQVDYVIEVTDSAKKVTRFYNNFCVERHMNPYIYGNNLKRLCIEIEDSELLIDISL